MSQSALWSANFSPVMASTSGAIAVGDVLTRLPGGNGGYVLCDSTNILTGIRPRALAITANGGGAGTVLAVSHGEVDNARTGLGSGTAGLVYVSAAGRLTRSGTGAAVGWCDTEGNALLDFSAPSQPYLEGLVVNVMQYYQAADGAPVINSTTTLNIGPAIGRAWAATCALGTRLTLWIPPAALYGVSAYSWDHPQVLVFTGSTQQWQVEIVGSGLASAILCARGQGITEKLYISGAGPQTMSCIFKYRHIFWIGDRSTGTDCTSLLRTSADLLVAIEDVTVYGVQSNGLGILDLSCSHLDLKRVFLHGCANAVSTGAHVYALSGNLGLSFDKLVSYPSEHTTEPFGGTTFSKSNASGGYVVHLGGDAAINAPHAVFKQCIFADAATGAVNLSPAPYAIDAVELVGCLWTQNTGKMVRADGSVRVIEIKGGKANPNAPSSLDLLASTVEHLVLDNMNMDTALPINANTGQKSVTVRRSKGGTFSLTSCAFVDFDTISTPYAVTAPAAGHARTYKLDAISDNNATVNMLATTGAEVALPDGKAFFATLRVTAGRTDASLAGASERKLTLRTTGGALTIVDNVEIYGTTTALGWGVTVSAPGGLTLRVAVDGAAGQTVQFCGLLDIVEVDSA